MDGIQYFSNLTYLNCNNNAITFLDATSLSNLQHLQICSNPLNTLSVSGLTNLKKLYCYYDSLNSLDLTGLVNLETLWCDNNNITSLDLNGLTALKYLQCRNNQLVSINNTANLNLTEFHSTNNHLTNLDLTGMNMLQYLDCSENSISSLDLHPAMGSLTLAYCGGNPLTSLDINGFGVEVLSVSGTLLTTIDCSQSGVVQLYAADCPNLQTINVRNGVFSSSDPDLLYYALRVYNNPNLISICTDDGEQNQLGFFEYNTNGNVVVYNGINCDIPVQVNMGITDIDKTLIKLYPNPANDILNVEVSNNQVITGIAVSNALGQTVMVFGNRPTLDISPLAKGTYFITVATDSGKATQRIVKL